MSKAVLATVEELIEPLLTPRDVSLFDIEFVTEGQENFLRVYIDKDGGVDLTECGIVSELISEVLDEKEPIKEGYYLEVSSPGAERPLRSEQEFIDYIGENVFVSLYVNIDGAKEYEGILKAFTNDIATIEYKEKTRVKQVEIPYGKIAKARLAVVF